MSSRQGGGAAVSETVGRVVPGELWGAFNLLSGVARSYVSKPDLLTPKVSMKQS